MVSIGNFGFGRMVTPAAVFSSPGPSGRSLSSPFWSNGVCSAAGADGGPASRPVFVFYRLDEAFFPLLCCHPDFILSP
jgi:hypothetical protein